MAACGPQVLWGHPASAAVSSPKALAILAGILLAAVGGSLVIAGLQRAPNAV